MIRIYVNLKADWTNSRRSMLLLATKHHDLTCLGMSVWWKPETGRVLRGNITESLPCFCTFHVNICYWPLPGTGQCYDAPFFLTECTHHYILNQTQWKCPIMIKKGLGMGWGYLKFVTAAFHPRACHKSWCIAWCSTTSTTKQMSFLVWDFIAELALSSADTILMVNELQGRLHLMQDSSHYSSWHWQNDRVVK